MRRLKMGERDMPSDASESSDDSDSRTRSKWSDISIDLFKSILEYIFSIPDLLLLSSACVSYRTLATTSLSGLSLNSFPPLLLQPATRRLRIVGGSRDDRFYRSMLSPETIDQRCLGCSHGHLISMLKDPTTDRITILITNVFTGSQISSPELPEILYLRPWENFAILTAPPSSPSCNFLWQIRKRLVCWNLATGDVQLYGPCSLLVTTMTVFQEKVYCINRDSPANLVEFDPSTGWQVTPLSASSAPEPAKVDHMYLVGCGENLLLVRCVGNCSTYILSAMVIYKLDFSSLSWVRLQSLGDWCLFVDFATGRPLACQNPRRWGGRENCVYVAGPGCITWIVVPLIDGTARISSVGNINMSRWTSWPCPMWVYPSVSFLT